MAVKAPKVIPGTKKAKVQEIQHGCFQKLSRLVELRLNAWLVGPAGSGKTSGAMMAARTLGLEFRSMSVSSQTTVSSLLGYMDANGNYVSTLFRDAFETGGVFLLDEVDAGNPNVLMVLNSAISANSCAFPDGMVEKHEDFVLVAAANTYGMGADRQYVGRNQIDAATLDRFVVLEWDYDTEMETKIAGNAKWVSEVQTVRWAIRELRVRHVVSPRASIHGAKMLEAGFSREEVYDMVVFKGLPVDDRRKVISMMESAKTAPQMEEAKKLVDTANYPVFKGDEDGLDWTDDGVIDAYAAWLKYAEDLWECEGIENDTDNTRVREPAPTGKVGRSLTGFRDAMRKVQEPQRSRLLLEMARYHGRCMVAASHTLVSFGNRF